MKKLSYKAKSLLIDAGIIIGIMALLLVMLFSSYAQASLINRYPYEAGTFKTLPQMQREREIRKQQDYALASRLLIR